MGLLEVAMQAPETFAAVVNYVDGRGRLTQRTVSPIRYTEDGRGVLVYCFCREGVRTLRLSRMVRVWVRHAGDVLAPEQIKEAEKAKETTG